MKTHYFSIQRFAAVLISLFLVGYLFIMGKPILAPLLFAAFLAFLLKPVVQRLEKWIGSSMWAIIITLFSFLTLLTAIILIFGMQLGEIIGNCGNIQSDLEVGFTKAFRGIGQLIGVPSSQIEDYFSNNISNWATLPTDLITGSIGSSVAVVGSFFLCILFTFFLLLYRRPFYNFMLYQFSEDDRKKGGIILRRIEKISKEYLNGLLLVIVILAVLNTLGLFIIGIKLALFWGLLGAFLAIIPYVGTFLGGLLPFIYAVSTYGLSWQPLAVIIFYVVVQSLEGNIITPKVIGKSVRINPFISVIALLIGGAIWGIAGIVLALPLIAIVRIIFSNIEFLQPVSELLRDDLYKREDVFEDQYDTDAHRLTSFFRAFRSEKRPQ